MVIRRLINAAHDVLGRCLDNLLTDPDLNCDARFEDKTADPFDRFRIDDNPRGRDWEMREFIADDAAHVRREDI